MDVGYLMGFYTLYSSSAESVLLQIAQVEGNTTTKNTKRTVRLQNSNKLLYQYWLLETVRVQVAIQCAGCRNYKLLQIADK